MATTKKPVNETTSKRVASIASKLLSNPKTPANVKTVAGTALTQAKNKKK
jgi:hypothetical protein